MTHILIVDDSPTIRRMVRASLSSLAAPELQLIVLDLNMPDMHGLEVLTFLRSQQKYRTLPIVVLTTRGDDASRQAALRAGASAFMTKPFTPQALAEQAHSLLASTPSGRA